MGFVVTIITVSLSLSKVVRSFFVWCLAVFVLFSRGFRRGLTKNGAPKEINVFTITPIVNMRQQEVNKST